MSNNILTYTGSGKTMYFIVLNSSGLYWKGNGFEIRNTSHWGQYVYMMTETSPGLYYGTFPSALGAGLYYIVGYRMIGGVASPTDTIERIGTMDWTGTEEFVGGNSGGGGHQLCFLRMGNMAKTPPPS